MNEFTVLEKKPILVLEPGISMVANAFIFVAKVIERKKIKEHQFCFS